MDYQKLLSFVLKKLEAGLLKLAFLLAQRCVKPTGLCWVVDTTAVYKMVILRYMVKLMRFARLAAKKLTVTKSWSLPLRLAGIVAV